MGGSFYSNDDYAARVSSKAAAGIPTFAYHDAVRTGKAHGVHKSLSPRGVTIRESRDSAEHPIAIPIALCNDLTGSMMAVPVTLQAKEPELMGLLLKDRAAGKTYMGDGYPAIMIAGVDDYFAIGAEGALQISQFESGLELDEAISNLWLTGQGGGNYGEGYDLFLYMLARKTAHDHYAKRHKKGHAFIIADEPLFALVSAKAVKDVIGDDIQDHIPIAKIIREVQQRYWLSLIIPNQTSHYSDPGLREGWKKAIGDQNVLLLDDPTQICPLIVSTIAMCEGTATLADLAADHIATGAVHKALVPLSKITGTALAAHSAEGLEPVAGAAGGTTRL